MSHYKHLTLEARERIMFFLAQGYSLTAIAKELGCHKSTISREVRRNWYYVKKKYNLNAQIFPLTSDRYGLI